MPIPAEFWEEEGHVRGWWAMGMRQFTPSPELKAKLKDWSHWKRPPAGAQWYEADYSGLEIRLATELCGKDLVDIPPKGTPEHKEYVEALRQTLADRPLYGGAV